jgi:hypothetical protein
MVRIRVGGVYLLMNKDNKQLNMIYNTYRNTN